MDAAGAAAPVCGPETAQENSYTQDFSTLRDSLPEQMVQARRWLVHRNKKPFYADGRPRSGQLDTPEDWASFASFDDACRALSTGRFTGVGFALGPDGTGYCWQGIDIDKIADHPELTHIIHDLPGYTERSPSGNGYHAIGYGRHFSTLGSNRSGIEAYSAGRFFTVTGDGAGLGEPVCIADFVEQKLKPMHSRRGNSPMPDTDTGYYVDDRTVKDLRSALYHMRSKPIATSNAPND